MQFEVFFSAVGLSKWCLSFGFCQRKRGRVCGAVRGAENAKLSESETALRSRLSVCDAFSQEFDLKRVFQQQLKNLK